MEESPKDFVPAANGCRKWSPPPMDGRRCKQLVFSRCGIPSLSIRPSRHLLPCLSLLPVIVMINARKPFGKNATEFPATNSYPSHSPVS